MLKHELQSATGVADLKLPSFNELTYTQKQRCSVFRGFYPEEQKAIHLTLLLEGKGERGFSKVNEKLEALMRAGYKEQQLDDDLAEAFTLGESVTDNEIIKTVTGVMRDHGRKVFISSIRRNCLAVFNSLFIVEVNTIEICCEEPIVSDSPKMKKVITGYTPIFKLKPEDQEV
ncbi:hypothetical protein [Mucilaginibacter sp.]|uniref:hypothetical protein n=1 Tax=Mucilaginibacter sp. TaxID=1882438 RepID=UPI0035BB9F51